jgi:tight adherence protein B
MIYGLDLRGALSYMADRLHTVSELKYVVSAIRIQSASGGNLAEVLGSLSKLMRNQQKLKMKVKALSAEGRLSGNILAGLPVGVFVLLTIISPAYYQGISENQILLGLMGIAGFLLAAGYIIMCRLVKIRV